MSHPSSSSSKNVPRRVLLIILGGMACMAALCVGGFFVLVNAPKEYRRTCDFVARDGRAYDLYIGGVKVGQTPYHMEHEEFLERVEEGYSAEGWPPPGCSGQGSTVTDGFLLSDADLDEPVNSEGDRVQYLRFEAQGERQDWLLRYRVVEVGGERVLEPAGSEGTWHGGLLGVEDQETFYFD